MIISFIFVALYAINKERDGPLLLTPMIAKGEFAKARAMAKIDSPAHDFGWSGFMTVPASAAPSSHILQY